MRNFTEQDAGALDRQIDELEEKIERAVSERGKLSEERDELQEQTTLAKAKLVELDEMTEQLRSLADEADDALLELERAGAPSDELRGAEDKLRQVDRDLKDAEREADKLDREVSKGEEQVAKLESDLSEIDDGIDESKADLEEMRQARSKLGESARFSEQFLFGAAIAGTLALIVAAGRAFAKWIVRMEDAQAAAEQRRRFIEDKIAGLEHNIAIMTERADVLRALV